MSDRITDTPIMQHFRERWGKTGDSYLHHSGEWKIAPRADGNAWVLYVRAGEAWVPVLNGDLQSAVHYVMAGGTHAG